MASVVDHGDIFATPTLTTLKPEFQKTTSTHHGYSTEHISIAG
jgi:hypothetical protein